MPSLHEPSSHEQRRHSHCCRKRRRITTFVVGASAALASTAAVCIALHHPKKEKRKFKKERNKPRPQQGHPEALLHFLLAATQENSDTAFDKDGTPQKRMGYACSKETRFGETTMNPLIRKHVFGGFVEHQSETSINTDENYEARDNKFCSTTTSVSVSAGKANWETGIDMTTTNALVKVESLRKRRECDYNCENIEVWNDTSCQSTASIPSTTASSPPHQNNHKTKLKEDIDNEENDNICAGMVMEVLPLGFDWAKFLTDANLNEKWGWVNEVNDSFYALTPSSSSIENETYVLLQQDQIHKEYKDGKQNFHRPCLFNTLYIDYDAKTEFNTNAVTEVSQYELVEQMHGQLGLVDGHSVDYAYRPVLDNLMSYRHHEQIQHPCSEQGKEVKKEEGGAIALWTRRWRRDGRSNVSGRFFRWPRFHFLGNFFDKRWNGHDDHRHCSSPPCSPPASPQEGSSEDNYERIEDRAFAGGAQGEVWRARRRCNLVIKYNEDNRQYADGSTSSSEYETSYQERHHYRSFQFSPMCDDHQALIMKRLKVERGEGLLEAGLREVYYGDMLSKAGMSDTSSTSSPLFTKYVDHFFRETTDSTNTKADFELWIVFEDAGQSLRSYLYTPAISGDFVLYQPSLFWRSLRMNVAGSNSKTTTPSPSSYSVAVVHGLSHHSTITGKTERRDTINVDREEEHKGSAANRSKTEGTVLMKSILFQILTSVAHLHERGIIHRDIKPSNIMCRADSILNLDGSSSPDANIRDMKCVLGDFSSAWDEFTGLNMYASGPSAAEQTDEYAPPEVLFGSEWVPFYEKKPETYDSWSIGVLALELMIGTPNVFSVDQRTTAILTNKLQKEGANAEDIQKALYLSALSQFCIYNPTISSEKSWPLRHGDPLHDVSIVKTTCTMKDFHNALRARDPLGIGFNSSSDSLLHLIWGLLAWDPMNRLTPSEALNHFYFKPQRERPCASSSVMVSPGEHNAVESQMLDPRMDIISPEAAVTEFICPKCGKSYSDYNSCHQHTTSRRHARFCTYDRSVLPSCLNAHSMLPAHPTSGYCDVQGRRLVIEDFHTVYLQQTHQFYGVFDGHNGNLASKYAASSFYKELVTRMDDVDDDFRSGGDWKEEVVEEMIDAFQDLHDGIVTAVNSYSGQVMEKSGTTATTLFVTQEAVIIANVGDSRAVLSVGASYDTRAPRVSYIQLTVDHVASNETERKRIEGLGGFVSLVGGTARVNGTLAVTRSLGDKHLAPLLSRTPHVVTLTRDDVKDQCRQDIHESISSGHTATITGRKMPCFIVLASDGLWDVLSNQDAVDMVEQVIRKYDPDHETSWEEGGAFQEAAQMLMQEAYVRGSMDNIAVCVVAIA